MPVKVEDIKCVLVMEKMFIPVPVIVKPANDIPQDLLLRFDDAKKYITTYLRDLADNIDMLDGKDKTDLLFNNNISLVTKFTKESDESESK